MSEDTACLNIVYPLCCSLLTPSQHVCLNADAYTEVFKLMPIEWVMEYYSAIKKNELMPFAAMDLDGPRDYHTK